MTKTEKKAVQVQKTIDKLSKQLEELKQLNNKAKDSRDSNESRRGWKNDSTISILQQHAGKLSQINLID